MGLELSSFYDAIITSCQQSVLPSALPCAFLLHHHGSYMCLEVDGVIYWNVSFFTL